MQNAFEIPFSASLSCREMAWIPEDIMKRPEENNSDQIFSSIFMASFSMILNLRSKAL
jgi:hypothetical protein